MRLQNEKPYGHGIKGLRQQFVRPVEQFFQRDKIAQRFAHFLTVNSDQVIVHPVTHTAFAARYGVLSQFTLVVREQQVHTSSVDIEYLSQVFGTHGRAFQVPARESFAPGGRPVHDMLGRGFFPQGKIMGRVFIFLSVQFPCVRLKVFQHASGKYPVVVLFVIRFYVKIDRTVNFIGQSGIKDLLYQGYLFQDMSRGSGFDAGGQGIEFCHGLVVAYGVILYHFHGLELFQAGLARNLVFPRVGIVLEMSHIGNVPDITYLISQMPEQTHQYIVSNSRTGMSQVRVAIYGRAADIKPYVAGYKRFEFFFLTGKRVMEVKISLHDCTLSMSANVQIF